MDKQQIAQLNEQFSKASPQDILTYFLEQHAGRIALASSLGAEDQVLTDMVMKIRPQTSVFTLDTGRLFSETYELIAQTNARYSMRMKVYFPDYKKVEPMVAEHGINLFYDSIDKRKQCCYIRKIEPLKRAFEGLEVWICGLRRDQSVTRFYTDTIEWDKGNGLVKINPLNYWTEQDVWDYIRKHDVPYNVLHNKGFPSIGCQPCTRAIGPDDDVRAGRWWWEQPEQKECGLHKAE